MAQRWTFGPFILDRDEPPLRCGSEEIPLPPKAFLVLCHLVENSEKKITHNELLNAVWGRLAEISFNVIKNNIGIIRKALKDKDRHTKYIGTLPRIGYRFIVKVEPLVESTKKTENTSFPIIPHPVLKLPNGNVVGRQSFLINLDEQFQCVTAKQRSIVFLMGEAGIGKSTVVQMFLNNLTEKNFDLLQGQCIEYHGSGEAFLPLLDAIARPCRDTNAKFLISKIWEIAPTWLEQMPWLLSTEEKRKLRSETLGANRDRMLREFCELIENISRERPLILILEDLHWADNATLGFLNFIARRHEPASLLIIGTYRPDEVQKKKIPIVRLSNELQNLPSSCCNSMLLTKLEKNDIQKYIEFLFKEQELKNFLTPIIYKRSEGNPLFMVNLVAHVVAQGKITKINGSWVIDKDLLGVEMGMPENLRQMIEHQIDELSSEEVHLLQVASAVGLDFSPALLAGVIGYDILDIESICNKLVRHGQMLIFVGNLELPNGAITGSYAFKHALYAELFYEYLPIGQRINVHGRIGKTLELIYGVNSEEKAAEASHHFELSRNFKKAIDFLSLAAHRSIRQFAHLQAKDYLNHALELVDKLKKADQIHEKVKLIQQRIRLEQSTYDMRSAQKDLELILSVARENEVRELEINALLDLARIFYWTDRGRVLDMVTSAVALASTLDNEPLLIQAKSNLGHWRIHLIGWSQYDYKACLAGLENARKGGDVYLIGIRQSNIAMAHCYKGRYRLALKFAEDAMKTLLEVGDAQYYYLLSQHYYVWAKLHTGDLGGALRTLKEYYDLAKKNENRLGILSALTELSWVNLECCQFDKAKRFAEKVLKSADINEISLYTQGLLMLGNSLLGLRDYSKAFECFNKINTLISDQGVIMESHSYFFLYRGLTEYWFTQSKMDKAYHSANELCQLAIRMDHIGYLALGYAWLTEINYYLGNKEGAELAKQQVIDAIGDDAGDYPLITWRIYAKLKEMSERNQHFKESQLYNNISAKVIYQLADSIHFDNPLREAFLSTPQIQISLGKKKLTSTFVSIL